LGGPTNIDTRGKLRAQNDVVDKVTKKAWLAGGKGLKRDDSETNGTKKYPPIGSNEKAGWPLG